MPVLTIIVVIVVVGLLLWLVNTYVPLQPPIKTILNVVIVLVLIIWLLKAFGLLGALNKVTV